MHRPVLRFRNQVHGAGFVGTPSVERRDVIREYLCDQMLLRLGRLRWSYGCTHGMSRLQATEIFETRRMVIAR